MIELAVALRRVGARSANLAALDERERALLPVRATSKRRDEFAAGRVAAHGALSRLLGAGAEGTAILPERREGGGRPTPVDAHGAPLPTYVSITHAAGLAAAAAAQRPVGIDLVSLEPLEDAFCDEAFVAGELAAWSVWAGGPAEVACLAFAAKEAALKWLGTGLELPLHAVRVAPAGAGLPARLGGVIAAQVLPVRILAGRGEVLLDGWVARSRRRVLVALCG